MMTADNHEKTENLVIADSIGSRIEGNLALVVDNSDRETDAPETDDSAVKPTIRPKLRLLKSDRPVAEEPAKEIWNSTEEQHGLRNPVIFMGLCLVVMVCLILFW
jgi:hypothetical protein